MTSYSSEQFYKDWRFQIDQDFVQATGDPYVYAEHGQMEWGDEELKIPFTDETSPSGMRSCSISHDGKYIAVGDGSDVKVCDLKDLKLNHNLQGHISRVDCVAFRPGSSTELASVAMGKSIGSKRADAQIIFWDLSEHTPNTLAVPQAVERLSRNAANSIIADIKALSGRVEVSASDQMLLATDLEEPISRLVRSRGATSNVKLFGRLLSSFQSEVYSSSGKYLIYMPGNAPRSNGDVDWELRLYSADRHEDAMIFAGHRDNIVWAGLNGDEDLLATASWDKTFRIWDVESGKQLHLFTTGRQNWTGGFSPDGQYFAGTSGDDKLHVYDLSNGTEHMLFDLGKHWSRALAWHPNNLAIAVGGDPLGKLFIIDVEDKTPLQHRKLSVAAMKTPDNIKRAAQGMLTTYAVHFVDGGNKLAFFTSGDGSIEVYDLKQGVKWRFARAGTMNSPEDESEVISKGGFGMRVYEDKANKKVVLVSLDTDALRFWSVPMTL